MPLLDQYLQCKTSEECKLCGGSGFIALDNFLMNFTEEVLETDA